MTEEEIKNSQENKVSTLAGELWNEILKVDNMQGIDKAILCQHIHVIQDMMLSKLFTKIHGKL